jgi:hypothetical protein
MSSEREQTGIPVPLRPLFVELSEDQLEAVHLTEIEIDEEAFVLAVVERARREGKDWCLAPQLRMVRAWSARQKDLSKPGLVRLRTWLRVLEQDEALHGGSAWTRNVDNVDLWPAMYYRKGEKKCAWDILTRYGCPLSDR